MVKGGIEGIVRSIYQYFNGSDVDDRFVGGVTRQYLHWIENIEDGGGIAGEKDILSGRILDDKEPASSETELSADQESADRKDTIAVPA